MKTLTTIHNWSPEFEESLFSATNYRDFLKLFFTKQRNWARPLRLTFQGFATRAGFASKSFMKDVISGRKRLTPKSYRATVIGLGLNKAWADYFETLIGIEEVSFQTALCTEEFYKERLKNLKRKMSHRRSTEAVNKPVTSETKSKDFIQQEFFRSIEKTKKRYRQQVSSSKSLFVTQAFLVSPEKLVHLKEKLEHLLTEFSSEAKGAEGDCRAEIILGFTNGSDL